MTRSTDSIYALSSGFGKAGVAVIRVSGNSVRKILSALIGHIPQNRQVVLSFLKRPTDGSILDHALVIFFEGPRSFTGEDVAEFHIHGGRAVVSALLQTLALFENTRMAEPGEFSRRAFAAGKMDLSEIESLGDLIDADTEAQRRQALRGLEGALSARAEKWRAQLLIALSWVEAQIDFPDEDDVAQDLHPDVERNMRLVAEEAKNLLNDGRRGERLRSGAVVAISGPPNAGKSSFLNKVAERNVAIVSPIAGTTRDAIEVSLDLEGFPVTMVDTAGIRDTTDDLEQQGVALARQWADAADLVLWFYDGSQNTPLMFPHSDKPLWMVRNKVDLMQEVGETDIGHYRISVKSGEGVSKLLDDLTYWVKSEFESGEEPLITRERHRTIITQLHAELHQSLQSIHLIGRELLAEDLRLACRTIGRISGRVDAEDVLENIFSSFCIGK
jgi:tRNA modification GTPase